MARRSSSDKDYANAPLMIRRFVSHCYNESPHNPLTWVLEKQLDHVKVLFGLAYDEKNREIDPEHSFFRVYEYDQSNRIRVRDTERVYKIYLDFINKTIRPLTNPRYLYPQARFLLKQSLIDEESLDELLQSEFIAKVLRDMR